MKKALTALALAVVAMTASATRVVAEYNLDRPATQPDGWARNHYVAVGVVQPLDDVTLDAFVQGAFARNRTLGHDRQSGWEVGISKSFEFGSVSLTPRLATGAMNRIDPPGLGQQLNARYWMASVEAGFPLVTGFTGYASASHMNDINADSIPRANRFQLGVDTSLTKNIGLRVGASTNKFGDNRLNGLVVVTSYSF